MKKEKLKEKQLLAWINNELDVNYKTIEGMADCVAFLQLLHMYFPN